MLAEQRWTEYKMVVDEAFALKGFFLIWVPNTILFRFENSGWKVAFHLNLF